MIADGERGELIRHIARWKAAMADYLSGRPARSFAVHDAVIRGALLKRLTRKRHFSPS
jgi:hypothetical protein